MIILSCTPSLPLATAQATDLFFSEYVEGSSNNKALEIYNGTGASVNLSTGNYTVEFYFNGSAVASRTIDLVGTVSSGDVFVLVDAAADAQIISLADQQGGTGWFNGDDAVVLKKDATILDVIGQIGVDPGSQWGSGLTSTQDNTLRRKGTVCAGDATANDAFDPASAWDGFAIDSFDGLGSHTASCGDLPPSVATTTPNNAATGVALDASITVTFSEDVTVTGSWFALSCTTSGTVTATASGGPRVYTLDPVGNFANNETCTVTMFATQVADQDDPVDPMATDYVFSFTLTAPNVCGASATLISAIQGTGDISPRVGEIHTVEAVVVGDFQASNLNGFFLQEEDADADSDLATSQGIFVYMADASVSVPDVSTGQLLRLNGTVVEFNGQTQLADLTSVAICPGTPIVSPATVNLPFATDTFAERYEGMLVTFPQSLTVNEHFNLARFGEVVLSAGRLYIPTSIKDPGPAAEAYAAANNRNRIILDDGQNGSYNEPIVHPDPGLAADNTLRSGYTTTGLTGVLSYAFNAYRVQTTVTPAFDPATNPRTATPARVAGTLRVASFNVLNYFNGDGQGSGFPTARGAENLDEFTRQRDKIIAAIEVMDADIVGLMEIENDGYGDNSAIQDLVNGLNAVAGADTYAFIDPGVAQIGTDQIAVGLLYKPATVTPIGDPQILDDTVDATFNDSRNRPALAQTFGQNVSDELFTVAVNHFKSKGSGCGSGDDDALQGNCNGTRTIAARSLVNWLADDPTGSGDPDVLIIGDLNAYAREDPISTIKDGGYSNLVAQFLGDTAYSYVFNGEAGYLDHALSSASLTPQITGVSEWHINADEPRAIDYNQDFLDGGSQTPKSPDQITSLYNADPYRASDHDPVIVGVDLGRALAVYLPLVLR